jgi:NTE family protein
MKSKSVTGSSPKKPKVVLVLQGGGALGAYHIGAYQALEEAGFRPDWVSGISIGAINAAILVGNEPDRRLTRLEELWHAISRPEGWTAPLTGAFHKLANTYSNLEALTLGQPNFFTPRLPNPYLAVPGAAGATSFYDTTPLRGTLERLASFDLVNAGPTRLSLGATKVVSGEVVFFDNTHQAIGPEHVMASGSLPPGFPAMVVDGELYWDGGCVSNTPLESVLLDQPAGHTIVFMIDLWAAQGAVPRTMDEVLWRQKQIQYASRTAQHIDAVATKLNLRRALSQQSAASHAARAVDPAVPGEVALQDARMDIVHITYQPTADQISSSDAEFSRRSIAARRDAGYQDLKRALREAPWFTRDKPEALCALVHKVEDGEVTTLPATQLTTGGAVTMKRSAA